MTTKTQDSRTAAASISTEEPSPHVTDSTTDWITYEQFLAIVKDGASAEWVEGKVVPMPPVSRHHNTLTVFLTRLLSEYADREDAGEVLTSPYPLRLKRSERGREPDIVFVAKERLERLTPQYLDGAADLIIEVVSPESVMRDRGEKYAEYEREGVREYWIIDPEERRADFFVLSEDGRYDRSRPDENGIFRSAALPGLWINVDWLWIEPPPKLRDVIKEWNGRESRSKDEA